MGVKSKTLWWPRYVGDYHRKTAHLSLAEHGAYVLLLDHYYSTGKPLPANAPTNVGTNASILFRICSAFAPEEQAAVMSVISQFFVLREDGYHNEKADEELVKRSEISKKRANAASGKGSSSPTIVGTNAPTNGGTNAHTVTPTVIEDNSNELSNGASPEKSGKVLLEGFDQFYAIYPNKKSPGLAEKAYKAAIKSGVDHETIIAGATAYAVQCQRNGTEKRFIKHPSTWLNGKCWLDEHSTDAENGGGTGRANSGAGARRGSILEAAAAAMGDGSGEFGLFADIGRGGPGYAQGDAGGGYRGATLDLPAIEPPRDCQGPDADQAYDQERQFDAGGNFYADGDLRR